MSKRVSFIKSVVRARAKHLFKSDLIGIEFAIGANIEQAARGVVGTSSESISVGKELDGIDV